ncbi:cathepsin S-like [Anticarsia gemmatalis]|uniref:cathepsin S-like n=1 Tax=Anticarsia gemmatalis TaxID=129554 RepID=UPI003F765C85
MKVLTIIFILNLSLIHSQLNITETTNKIKYILTNYKQKRCVSDKMESFVSKTLKLVEKNKGLDDFMDSFNVSQCAVDASSDYVKRHILDGLIIQEDLPDTHWFNYKSVHKKEYKTLEQELEALSKWRKNLQRVAQHNRDFLAGKQSYSLHLNHFGDLDVKEYFYKFLKLYQTFPLFDPAEDHHKTTFRRNVHVTVPKQFDWRSKGFRPRHEEQFHCGACYAFAVTHALQAQLYKRHGFWGELSPQQIVDCSFRDGNSGCNGGSLRAALKYAAREGLIKESQYPYKGKRGDCKYNRYQVRVRAKRWATLPMHDEDAIEKAIVTIGPLAVAVNAAPFTFQLYRSGVYDDLFCTSWQLNHAMLLVGYTQDYWILLNWWGQNWGEDGYIRIRRGFNHCGVANMATYVEI